MPSNCGRICSGRGFRDDPQVMEDLCGQLADILEEEGYPEEALELYFGALFGTIGAENKAARSPAVT